MHCASDVAPDPCVNAKSGQLTHALRSVRSPGESAGFANVPDEQLNAIPELHHAPGGHSRHSARLGGTRPRHASGIVEPAEQLKPAGHARQPSALAVASCGAKVPGAHTVGLAAPASQ